MTIYLVKGSLDLAATTAADAALLIAAMDNPASAANVATIDRVCGKLESLVLADTGEPLVISSVDDAAGTISSWVTDAGVTLHVAMGDPDAGGAWLYTQTSDFAIVGETRVGSLAMNGQAVTNALARKLGRWGRGASFTLHILKETAGARETVALMKVRVLANVLGA